MISPTIAPNPIYISVNSLLIYPAQSAKSVAQVVSRQHVAEQSKPLDEQLAALAEFDLFFFPLAETKLNYITNIRRVKARS